MRDYVIERPGWFPDWRGQTVVLVGSGPSANDVNLSVVRDRARVVVVNDSWRLAPWADILYASDHEWWSKNNGLPDFKGIRATTDDQAANDFGLCFAYCRRVLDNLIVDRSGDIGWGGNSGFGALNLAVKFGVSRIVLVGYDMTTDYGLHWHKDHGSGLHNPSQKNIGRWRRAIDNAAPVLESLSIQTFNASPISALQAYPKVSLDEVFRGSD